MSIRESFMIKTVRGDTDLTLEAKVGESLLIKGVRIDNPAASYVTLSINKSMVGYFRVGGVLGNQLAFPKGQKEYLSSPAVAAATWLIRKAGKVPNILDYMIERDWLAGYPVAEGETFLIEDAAGAGAIQTIIYEVHDAEDIKNTDPNGSKASEYVYCNYGRTAATVDSSATTIYDTSQTPVEFPAFPFGADVPAKTEILLLGIATSDFSPSENTNAANIATSFLKLVKERITLFDDDKNGLLLEGINAIVNGGTDLVGAGMSIPGQCSDIDRREPFELPDPIVFSSGEELNVYLSTVIEGAGQDILVSDGEVTLLEKVIRTE